MEDQEKNHNLIDTNTADWYDHNGEAKSNDYPHLGNKYRSLNEEAKKALTSNIINTIREIDGPEREMAVNLQLCHWFRTDMGLGMAVANGLNINLAEMMKQMPQL